jgi:hypothetical protein
MTKPKRFQYQIQYTDNSTRIVDWSKPDFNQVALAMSKEQTVSIMEDGIFVLKDIRTIVLIPEIQESEKQLADAKHQLTEWGFVDDATAVYLKEVLGIDLGQLGGN